MSSFSAGASSGSLSESMRADFFFFGIFFSVSLPDESLKTCLFRLSPPIGEALRLRLPDLCEGLRLRLPDLCDGLRLPDLCEALLDRFDCGEPLLERFVCGDPLFERFVCGEPLLERFVWGEPLLERFVCGESGVPLRDRFE